jgi:hypothetical protein
MCGWERNSCFYRRCNMKVLYSLSKFSPPHTSRTNSELKLQFFKRWNWTEIKAAFVCTTSHGAVLAYSSHFHEEIPCFVLPEISLPHSQKPTSGPHFEPNQPSPKSHILFSKDFFFCISFLFKRADLLDILLRRPRFHACYLSRPLRPFLFNPLKTKHICFI